MKSENQLTYHPLNLRSSNHKRRGTGFLFLQALGTWYVLLHTPNDYENNFDCVVATYAPPQENIGLITLEAYDIR
jgi:hypothetical protein